MRVVTSITAGILALLLASSLAYAGYWMCDEKGCKYCTVSESGNISCY